MVDDKAPDATPVTLSPGPHVVAISAPLHLFFVDTVNIRSGLELTYAPELTPVGEPLRPRVRAAQGLPPLDTTAINCEQLGLGYNRNQVCWDTRAAPVAPPRVTVPASMTPLPSPATLAVKVNIDGTTAEVAMLRPSDSAEFNDMASRYVMTMRWTPAKKQGAPVVGWTQIRLEPISP